MTRGWPARARQWQSNRSLLTDPCNIDYLTGYEAWLLAPGMTFHLMPGLWQDGRSIVITEPFIVTPTGAEPLCTFERRLLVKSAMEDPS